MTIHIWNVCQLSMKWIVRSPTLRMPLTIAIMMQLSQQVSIQHSHFQIIIQSPSLSHPVNIHLISALWHQCSLLLLDQPVHHDGPERDFCQICNHWDRISHGPHDSCIHPTHGQVVDEHHSEMWRLINPTLQGAEDERSTCMVWAACSSSPSSSPSPSLSRSSSSTSHPSFVCFGVK